MKPEKRLINLDHALQAVSENYRSDMPKFELDMLVATRKRLKSMPTVDAVEVVRCKDCRFWEECESSLIGKVMCCTGQGFARIQKSAEDYCSFGERRIDGT